MKKIVIDARLYGTKHTGIGRYIQNLLREMKSLQEFTKYHFVLLVAADQKKEVCDDLGGGYEYVPVSVKHYSLKEQLILPWIIYGLKADLVHFTHFNKPLLYWGKSVVTIHDLIKHFSRGKETTTRQRWLYLLKFSAYRLITRWVIKTDDLLVPSNFWRNYIIENYRLPPKKITTTYEAVDEKFIELANKKTANNKMLPYLVYTGNLYPHKNIDVVLRALKLLKGVRFKVSCTNNIFVKRMLEKARKCGVADKVDYMGFLTDEEIVEKYRRAIALVHPSLLEGFSLTGLEAMALDCPVIAANASCLPEVYGDSVLYFEPNDEKELAARVEELRDNKKLRQELIGKGKKQLLKYSWKKTAKETYAVYKKLLNET